MILADLAPSSDRKALKKSAPGTAIGAGIDEFTVVSNRAESRKEPYVVNVFSSPETVRRTFRVAVFPFNLLSNCHVRASTGSHFTVYPWFAGYSFPSNLNVPVATQQPLTRVSPDPVGSNNSDI